MAAALAAAVGLHAAQQNNQQAGGLQRNPACLCGFLGDSAVEMERLLLGCMLLNETTSKQVGAGDFFFRSACAGVLCAVRCCVLPDSSPAAGATLRV